MLLYFRSRFEGESIENPRCTAACCRAEILGVGMSYLLDAYCRHKLPEYNEPSISVH